LEEPLPVDVLARLIRTFAEIALSGKPQPHWAEVALKTQQALEACLTSAREGREVRL
jgi:predicted dehydrogenase